MLTVKRITPWCLMALCLLILLSACTIFEDRDVNDAKKKTVKVYEPKPDPTVSQISTYNPERLSDQDQTEQAILETYQQGTYTPSDPFIKTDPYDASPLSALVMFETEKPSQVKVTTGIGEDEEPINKSWDEYRTSHAIPVLGLYPDKDNQVKMEVTDEDGQTEAYDLTIKTDPLPEDFLETTVVEAHPEKMEDGLTYIVPTSGYLYAVDQNADVRWYSSLRSRLVFKRLNNGHFLQTTRKPEAKQYNELLELDMLGKIYNAYNIHIEGYDPDENNLIHHEVIELPSGNLLATTHEPNSKYVEDHMHEIDRETGITTQVINLRDVMPENAPDDYDGKNADINDWIHQNAIWYDDSDNSILVSGRSQDVILKMSYPDAELKWILGAHEKWPESYEKYLLEPLGDVKFPAGQHAMKIVDNPELKDTPEIKDVILFDNNEVIIRGNRDVSQTYSQAIRYRINEEEMTVEQTWSYGKDRGESFFSHIIGNVQYLYGTDNLILNSGATQDDTSPTGVTGRIVEVDTTEDPDVIFELEVQGKKEDSVKYTYRTWRWPLYPDKEWNYEIGDNKQP